MGYLLAFISSIFFSLYVIPRKLSDQPVLLFSLLTGIGFFVSSTALYLVRLMIGLHEQPNAALLWSIPAGIVWAAAFVLLVKSIDAIGFARSNQWKNLQGPIGVLFCLIILGEYADANPVFALLAGLAVFASAAAFTISSSKTQAKLHLRGVYLAALSGLGFGVVTVINKYVTTEVGVYSQQVVWSLSIVISLLLYISLQKGLLAKLKIIDTRNVSLGLGAGLLFLGASFFMLQSYKHIPASIGFTIVQLNAVWTVVIGIFLFKEIDSRTYYKRIITGFLLALIGIALLALAIK